MRVVFVRHGQSTGNAGVPCDDLASIELTDLGWSQARQVAEDWQERPALIVTSPYLRTQQTAAPTIERFPDVSVEVWPIEEFTYLQPSRWNGTRSAERMPHLERYWSEADPAYCDGDGAESFAGLLARGRSALDRLATLPSSCLAYVFSHGQFIQAVRAIVTEPELDDRGKMLRFWRKGEPPAIGNGEMILFEWQDGCWHHRPGDRANFDRVVGSIDADLSLLHKQIWIEKATKLRDAVRRSEGAEQERAAGSPRPLPEPSSPRDEPGRDHAPLTPEALSD